MLVARLQCAFAKALGTLLALFHMWSEEELVVERRWSRELDHKTPDHKRSALGLTRLSEPSSWHAAWVQSETRQCLKRLMEFHVTAEGNCAQVTNEVRAQKNAVGICVH